MSAAYWRLPFQFGASGAAPSQLCKAGRLSRACLISMTSARISAASDHA